MSGVKFLKTFAPSIRRRRHCDKEKLEIYNLEQNNDSVINVWDTVPVSPITPPAAFLPPGYKRLSTSSESSKGKADYCLCIEWGGQGCVGYGMVPNWYRVSVKATHTRKRPLLYDICTILL